LAPCRFPRRTLVERGPWSGALTPTSAVVKAKIAVKVDSLRLALSTNADLSRPFYVPAENSDSRIATFKPKHLAPNRYYYYAFESKGLIDTQNRGRFRTYPDGPTSFTFAFASCARTASSHSVFETILRDNPLFFMNIGDLHYLDIKENNPDRFRAAYDLVLSSRHSVRTLSQHPFRLHVGRPRLRR
jgi:alkaline phosphatase D